MRAPALVRPEIETDVLGRTKKYLTEQRIRWIRIHCGVVFRGRCAMHLAPKGTPDLVVSIPPGRRCMNPWTRQQETLYPVARIGWIETKEEAEGRLSKEQRAFQTAAQEAGEMYWVVRSLADVRWALPPVGELDFGGGR
jgi:hypothetical protein